METTLKEEKLTATAAAQLGLSEEEFNTIVEILGRTPNFTELSMYSVMWSEHCSYKNSIFWLKTLPRDGKHLLAKAGEENAGLVDIGGGYAIAFKIESHNHPSAIEPYQGAATGVGGINRDIFTMGARPIAQLNSLRFGDPADEKTKHLIKGVVKGIGDYGNSFGVPTVGGEVYFDESYRVNPLVNAMSVGIVKTGAQVSAIAAGEGNLVYIIGSFTGKDGIHGATFASAELTEDSAESLPSVQVGDPFQEKLLLEAMLETIKTGGVVGMQDMGAAGIICSTSEMCAKGECGMLINLDKVPLRQPGMQPFEILLSESQERMLMVVTKGKEAEVEKIFKKWDLPYAIIGEVITEKRLKFYIHGDLIGDVPPESLVLGGGAPVYKREFKEPLYFKNYQNFDAGKIAIPSNLKEVARFLITNPNIASKKWVYEQYDSMVGTINMSTNGASDAAIVNIKKTDTAIALKVDCNARYVHADPRKGAAIAVAEAARNIVCSGGKPVAITNCLNFGNPYNPEVYWQFVEVIKGMTEACNRFETPVTGGNVSFYNQSYDGPVFPTPVIGMLGVLKDKNKRMTLSFKNPGDLIYLIGKSTNDIACSEYLYSWYKIKGSPSPHFDLEEEYAVQKVTTEVIDKGLINSAHDCSDGGLYITLIESTLPGMIGFNIVSDSSVRKDAFLFGECQSRIVVSVSPSNEQQFNDVIFNHRVSFVKLGNTGGDSAIIDDEDFGKIKDIKSEYDNALCKIMDLVPNLLKD